MGLPSFPISLPLTGRSVLIVGGGEGALRKARLLAKSPARLIVVAPDALPALAALAGEVRTRPLEPADLPGHALVFAATGDDEQDMATAALARAAGVPVNVPDRPELCDFIMPAIIDREPLMIAISSGGASPVLVRRLRERLEAALEPGLGRFARLMDGFRGTVKQTRDSDTARRRFWEAVIDGPIGRLFLAGNEQAAQDSLLLAVNDPGYGQQAAGSVALVGAGPGDPDLLTLRALRLLQNADVIVHDKLVDERVLDYVRRDARRIYVGKSRSRHTLTQDAINAVIVAEARAGHRVVRLKGGDPFIFGRGGEEMQACRTAGIAVEVVPGITAALGCGAATGVPLTHRDHASGVTFVTGHVRDGEPDLDWAALARLRHTLVIYMGLNACGRIADRLLAAGISPDTPAALIENGTRPDQILAAGTLSDLPLLAQQHQLRGPALIIIGEVVRLADPAQLRQTLAASPFPHAIAAE
jgi:uroporphyrin-III C-methyltransferase / precorrin-2 dehydrogenase / sirohydrochlorin ferrochelatase